ncbi:MAG TPA: GAF and ANTAR domain-containing protein [Pseudonocardiaceae bacterium]|nr:GAF and ANTAR domain-containing protein [Pseudonocardiaceae bacterium]
MLRAVTTQLAGLTRVLLDTTSVAEVLDRVVVATREAIPEADMVSVTLRGPDGTYYTPAETDPIADELDQIQYEQGEGPCVDVARTPGLVLAEADDLDGDRPWPKFGRAAIERGYHSVVATALLPASRPPQLVGALNVYSRHRLGLTSADRDIALLLATHASLALANVQANDNAALQAAHLRKAIESRDVIGQAKGILMSRRGIGADEAFQILRKVSQDLNVKLANLAETLTERHTELDIG